jgi:hypothetical protein
MIFHRIDNGAYSTYQSNGVGMTTVKAIRFHFQGGASRNGCGSVDGHGGDALGA